MNKIISNFLRISKPKYKIFLSFSAIVGVSLFFGYPPTTYKLSAIPTNEVYADREISVYEPGINKTFDVNDYTNRGRLDKYADVAKVVARRRDNAVIITFKNLDRVHDNDGEWYKACKSNTPKMIIPENRHSHIRDVQISIAMAALLAKKRVSFGYFYSECEDGGSEAHGKSGTGILDVISLRDESIN